MYILNAFSASMLTLPCNVRFKEVSLEEAQVHALFGVSAVGHADTAALFSALLATHVPANRVSVTLKKAQQALLGQLMLPPGHRIPEGCTKLPEGSSIKWILVSVT